MDSFCQVGSALPRQFSGVERARKGLTLLFLFFVPAETCKSLAAGCSLLAVV